MAKRKQVAPIPPNVMAFFKKMGAAGGRKGASKRWKNVPPDVRREGARRAALARWAKQKPPRTR